MVLRIRILRIDQRYRIGIEFFTSRVNIGVKVISSPLHFPITSTAFGNACVINTIVIPMYILRSIDPMFIPVIQLHRDFALIAFAVDSPVGSGAVNAAIIFHVGYVVTGNPNMAPGSHRESGALAARSRTRTSERVAAFLKSFLIV